MTRRFWLRSVAWLVGWISFWRGANADEQQATLNETLRSVLKCRRPQEFAYVDLVTAKVDQGVLPRALVLSMMTWARDRSRKEVAEGRRKNDIPFPYFQEGLRLRAAQIGVSLPAFSL
jgi:hypothetical protein